MNGAGTSQTHQPERRTISEHYVPERPTPDDPVPWASSAPSPHTQMQPGTTRHLELIRNQLRIEDARTDYEIRYIIDHGLSGLELWPPETLSQHERDFPVPKYDPQWKTKVYMKKELEDFILNEDVPVVQRVAALLDRCWIMDHAYSRFDLIEKGRAMLHELKFRVSGDKDWKRILDLEYLIGRRARQGRTKDTLDPRSWKQAFDIPLAQFIKEQLVDQMRIEGYDLDVQFSRIYGLESSPRVKQGEPPVHWEGWDPSGPVDWGWFRINKMASARRAMANGHAPQMSRAQQRGTSEEESDEEERVVRRIATEMEDEEASEEEDEELDDSEVSEILDELHRASSDGREASEERESSSDIEITGSNVIQPRQPPSDEEEYSEEEQSEEEASQLSAVEGYLDEEAEETDGQEGTYDEDDAEDYDDDEEPYDQEDEPIKSRDEEDDDEETEREPDDKSDGDSDELEILEEHHYGGRNFEENQWQKPSVYTIRAAQTVANEAEEVEEEEEEADAEAEDEDEDDAQSRSGLDEYEDDLEGEHDSGAQPQTFYPEEMGYDGLGNGYDGQAEEDFERAEINDHPLQMSEISSVPIASGVSSPLSSLDSEQIATLDPMLDSGAAKNAVSFSDLAKRAMERAGAAQSVKTSETSGLSSPPSSMSSLVQEETEETVIEHTESENAEMDGGDIIDPALLGA